jgi:energy-coupling factor transporter ATP-binding protein EcfA2
MILKSLEYSQFTGQPNEWYLEQVLFGKINLIVGKNATGKTKILNIIRNLANLVAGEHKLIFLSGNYKMVFEKDGQNIEYILCFENQEIYQEQLKIGEDIRLERGVGGAGRIFAQQLNQQIEFQAPVNELVCVARRDSVQHPFFEDLYQWGKTTYHYFFGSPLGKDHLAVFVKGQKEGNLNLKHTDKVVGILKKGLDKHGSAFSESIKKDMVSIGYKIDDIFIAPLKSIKVEGGVIATPEGIHIKEADIPASTDQNGMSQGMFRALSLIIQVTLSQLEGAPSCILIDDIGEGLDFDRSSSLIKLLIEKANSSSVQLIMSTNDRFVMNNVPLEYWGVVQRMGQKCKVFNYTNSKKTFDDFAYTGLANFDFLSTEFYLKGFDNE